MKIIPFFQKTSSVFFAVILLLGGIQKSLPENQDNVVQKKLDLSQYGTVASLDINATKEKIAIGFTGCDLIFINQEFQQQKNSKIDNCKRFFKARYGMLDGKEFVISSIYTGESILDNSQQRIAIPLHTAAVTDSLLIQNYLLSSSDDGSVQIAYISSLNPAEIKPESLYQSIGVARNLTYIIIENETKVAVSYDSGEIAIFSLTENVLKTQIIPNVIHPIKSRINAFKFTPDGSKLLIGYFTGELVEFDLTTKITRTLTQTLANAWLNSLDVNSQNIVAFGDDQGYVKTISLETGKILENQVSDTGIAAVLFVDDQTLLAADTKGIIYQIRVASSMQFENH